MTAVFAGPTNAVSVTVSRAMESGTWQNSVSTLVTTTLQGASDPDGSGLAGFNTYWGSDSEGACTTPITGTVFPHLDPVPGGTPYYLRIQARDLAGNLSACETRFIRRYDNEPPIPAQKAWPLTASRPPQAAGFVYSCELSRCKRDLRGRAACLLTWQPV